jgi:hypothetical protein
MFFFARAPGFEPRSTVLETAILPLNYARIFVSSCAPFSFPSSFPSLNVKVKVRSSSEETHLHMYRYKYILLDNFGHLTSTYSTTTLADSETKSFVHGDWSNQFYVD